MKSVVVEASTVAKAIEIAWLKAGKPEEYFIRVLQEHQSGFLGFGSQKAKVVLFFKNSNKSDSLFPVVLKQKEYTSLFNNNNLKVPKELNVVDAELNKNISLGHGQQKKKSSSLAKTSDNAKVATDKSVDSTRNQHSNNQQKPKQNNQASDVTAHKPGTQTPTKIVLHKTPHSNKPNSNGQSVKPVQVQNGSDLASKNPANVAKPVHQHKQPSQTVSSGMSADDVHKTVSVAHKPNTQVKAVENKDDVVTNIAKALKKVQSQKIVANVSRPSSFAKASADTLHKISPRVDESSTSVARPDKIKSTAPKFESYEEYINSTKQPESSKSVISEIQDILAVVDAVVKPAVEKTIVASEELAVQTDKTAMVAPSVQDKPAVTTPRVPIKMKRRPLTTDNPGVSGITRSSSLPKPAVTSSEVATETVVADLDKTE